MKGECMLESVLTTPGLPDKKVTSVLVSSEYPNIINSLKMLNIQVIPVPVNTSLEKGIATHPDCMLFHLDSNKIFVDSSISGTIVNYLTIVNQLKNAEIKIIGETVKSPYPCDVRLNCIRIADKIICNTKYLSVDLSATSQELGIEHVHVNQGYAACSAIVLNNNAVITDDESIHCAATKSGIDSLLVSKGSVRLNNHNYGFIGGTCGMIDKHLLAFTGDIKTHSDSALIISFLDKYNVNYICLTNDILTDIGGIIPLTQNV